MQSERVVETVPLSSEPATTPVPRMEASNASIPTVSSVGVLHPEDPIGNPVKPTVWPMHDRHVANIVDKPMRNIGTTVAYADTYPVTHGDGSPVTLQDVHPVHRRNLYPANHPASEPVYTPGEMMVGGTLTEADPFRKTASMRSRQTIPEDDETRKWRKHIPIHLAVIFTYEFLLSLAGIILNIWLPGVAIISALAILFTGLLFMIIAERKVKQYTFVSYYARFNFIAFFSAFLVTLFFGIWAICAAAGVAPRNVTVYLVIPSLVTFFFHILYNLSNVIFISKAVKHTDLPMREKLPQYEEVYLENDKSAMQKREPLPVYTRTAAPVGSTTAVAPAAAPAPGATVW